MGSSTRYSSAADDHPLALKSHSADASGSSPISATDSSAELLLALTRVEQSLRLVLAHIATIQREMGITQSQVNDIPLRPDDSWVGTP